jgi:hypothetical protein
LQKRKKTDEAQITVTTYQRKAAQYFNMKVRHRDFKLGDCVLRKVTIATRDPDGVKLGLTWEEPYQVINNHRQGAYHL